MGASNKRCSLQKNENFTQKTNKQTKKQTPSLVFFKDFAYFFGTPI